MFHSTDICAFVRLRPWNHLLKSLLQLDHSVCFLQAPHHLNMKKFHCLIFYLSALYLALVSQWLTHCLFWNLTQRVTFETWDPSVILSEWCLDRNTERQKDRNTERQKNKKAKRWKKTQRHKDKKTTKTKKKDKQTKSQKKEEEKKTKVSHFCDAESNTIFVWHNILTPFYRPGVEAETSCALNINLASYLWCLDFKDS